MKLLKLQRHKDVDHRQTEFWVNVDHILKMVPSPHGGTTIYFGAQNMYQEVVSSSVDEVIEGIRNLFKEGNSNG
jgi:uncharacterized protein YlzI (FlbEa/FlbD family)